MPSAATLDIPALLAPAPGDKPHGSDPREAAGTATPYYRAKDARNAARAAERAMENGDSDAPPADWRPVAQAAITVLANSKDLELAAYLCEAQLRVAGFAGLRDGFRLLAGLVRGFWPHCYPVADEDGVTTTLAPVTGLNGEDAPGTLLAPIYRVPLAMSSTLGPVTYAHYVEAQATSKILDEKAKAKKIADGALTFELLKAAFGESPASATRTLYDDLAEAQEAFTDLAEAFGTAAGSYAPPTSAVRAALDAVRDTIKDLGRDQLAATMPAAAPPPVAEPEANGAIAVPGANGSADASSEPAGERLPVIRGRDDALAAIDQIASYFRRTEPQSLVPYALDQAVRWARMPVADLLRELIPDDDARGALFKQVGVPGGAE